MLDTLYSFFDTHDITPFSSILSDDGLFLGTDGSEFWDKVTAVQAHEAMFEVPEFKFTYTQTNRVIRVADDGKSALVIDQIENTPVFGPDMPVRITSLVVNTEDGWKVDYMGWSLIPDNEDLTAISAVLAE